MFSPIITMFTYFPLRAWSTVLILLLISRYTYRKTREKWETDRLTKTQSYAQWLLVSYILLLLFLTVLGRRSMDYYRYNFDIGYSYRSVYYNGNLQMLPTIAVNIAMFVPVGFLGAIGFKRFGILKALLLGVLLTASIEFLQLMLRNGTCEIDDLISNTAGTICGCLPGQIIRSLLKRKTERYHSKKEFDSMKRVYLTALTNERYIPGVMALARSLREVDAQYPLAIMIPEEKAEELTKAIQDYGVLKLPNVFLLPKENVPVQETRELSLVVEEKYSYWRDTFFKLQAAGCTEFEKIILLDCDQMAVKNIDHLFGALPLTSTTCGRCVHEDWLGLSSGMLVIEPSREMHEKVLSFILPAVELKQSKGLQAGDQDVFHLAFPEWRERPDLYISEKYNICWGWIGDLCRKENCTPGDFYMIHFPGKEKPWDYNKYFYLRYFVSLIKNRKTEQLLYKVLIWRKYRNLCERI